MWRAWEIGIHTFPKVWVVLWFSSRFLSYGLLHHMENIWMIPSIRHSTEKCSKHTHWRELGKLPHILWEERKKLVSILFPKYGWFSSIRWPSCNMLYRMGNAWLFQSIFHSLGKFIKVHPMRENWNIYSHTFSQVRLFLFMKFLPYGILHEIIWYSSSHENLGYRYPYFFKVIRPSVPSNFHPMVYYIPWMVHVFSHKFHLAWLNSVKHLYNMGRTWNTDIHKFLRLCVLFRQTPVSCNTKKRHPISTLCSECISFHK